jgi:hypothetical protein
MPLPAVRLTLPVHWPQDQCGLGVLDAPSYRQAADQLAEAGQRRSSFAKGVLELEAGIHRMSIFVDTDDWIEFHWDAKRLKTDRASLLRSRRRPSAWNEINAGQSTV